QAWQVIAVTLAEHFFGGLLTISLFAYMMSRVDKRMGATHYTIFASLEAAGKGPWSWSSGLLAENLGYSAAFGLALALTLLVMLLYPLVREKERDEAGTRS
ncbi:MAG TPA: MFS transporter, partial [Spirochaetota bacterium]|nr:MFS transporter [Spirochaetota bacterium]